MKRWSPFLPEPPLGVGNQTNEDVMVAALERTDPGDPSHAVGEMLNDSMALDLFAVARGVFQVARQLLNESVFEEFYNSSVDAYLGLVDVEKLRIGSQNRGSGSNEVDLIIGGGFGTAAYKGAEEFSDFRSIATSRLSSMSVQERSMFRSHAVAFFRAQRALFIEDVSVADIQDELVRRLYVPLRPPS